MSDANDCRCGHSLDRHGGWKGWCDDADCLCCKFIPAAAPSPSPRDPRLAALEGLRIEAASLAKRLHGQDVVQRLAIALDLVDATRPASPRENSATPDPDSDYGEAIRSAMESAKDRDLGVAGWELDLIRRRADAAVARARSEGRREAEGAYQDAAGRVAVLVAMLREYQGANRIHNDSEADLFERAEAVLGLPPIPLTLRAALASREVDHG